MPSNGSLGSHKFPEKFGWIHSRTEIFRYAWRNKGYGALWLQDESAYLLPKQQPGVKAPKMPAE